MLTSQKSVLPLLWESVLHWRDRMNTPNESDSTLDRAGGGVIATLTLFFNEGAPAAEKYFEKLKEECAPDVCDFLFGAFLSILGQLAFAYEVEPLELVQTMGMNLAQNVSGVEET